MLRFCEGLLNLTTEGAADNRLQIFDENHDIRSLSHLRQKIKRKKPHEICVIERRLDVHMHLTSFEKFCLCMFSCNLRTRYKQRTRHMIIYGTHVVTPFSHTINERYRYKALRTTILEMCTQMYTSRSLYRSFEKDNKIASAQEKNYTSGVFVEVE